MTYKYLSEHVETIRIDRKESVCANCRHFYQYWIASGDTMYYERVAGLTQKRIQWFHPIDVGHCAYPRKKRRSVGDTCPRFEPREGEPAEQQRRGEE